MPERCFACNREIKTMVYEKTYMDVLVDGENTTVRVGMECYRKVRKMDKHGGYQPPLGGPKLFLVGSLG